MKKSGHLGDAFQLAIFVMAMSRWGRYVSFTQIYHSPLAHISHVPSGKLTELLKIAIYSGFIHKKSEIFHSYVTLPEGMYPIKLYPFPIIWIAPQQTLV